MPNILTSWTMRVYAIFVWQGKMSGCWYANYFLLNCKAKKIKQTNKHTHSQHNKFWSNIVNAKFICIIKRILNYPPLCEIWYFFLLARCILLLFLCLLFFFCLYTSRCFVFCVYVENFRFIGWMGKIAFWMCIYMVLMLLNSRRKSYWCVVSVYRKWLCQYFISFLTFHFHQPIWIQ